MDGLFQNFLAVYRARVAAIAAFVPIFYYKKFRPTTKDVARRIDRLGLEERIITMTELEKDESYIAMRQREDAKRKLGAVDAKQIRFRFSTAAAVVAAICAVLGVSMTTVTDLERAGRSSRRRGVYKQH